MACGNHVSRREAQRFLGTQVEDDFRDTLQTTATYEFLSFHHD
jgi:hypothetical protein